MVRGSISGQKLDIGIKDSTNPTSEKGTENISLKRVNFKKDNGTEVL